MEHVGCDFDLTPHGELLLPHIKRIYPPCQEGCINNTTIVVPPGLPDPGWFRLSSLAEYFGQGSTVTEAASETFDFIVTGAGSAGCAVAGRLSESGKHRVLLLEAGGPDRNPWIHVPLGYTRTYTDPRVNWMFESEPEAQLNDRTLYVPRGKVLGGTSSINGMVYMRGTPADYDNWRQRGCEGWDWENVLPFFKKAENQERGADAFHGVGGPLCVSNPVRSPLGDAMVKAAVEAGIP